ncbi:MAG: metallophosphoesterase family protein [Chloroflexia bacterium]
MTSIAIISDIHGNCFALDAVLADLETKPANRIVCLGDAIQGGPQPAEVVARLRVLGCPVVMGNADAWLLSGINTSTIEGVTEKQERVRQWQLSLLSEDDRRFIASFQPTVEISLDVVDLLCFHGSPASYDELIFPETPEDEFQRMLGAYTGRVLTGGHTHLQQVRRLGDYFFFNPGSIGVPYNRHQPEEGFQLDRWAEYAVLSVNDGRLDLNFRRVPLDVNSLVETFIASGRPYADEWVAQYKGRTD